MKKSSRIQLLCMLLACASAGALAVSMDASNQEGIDAAKSANGTTSADPNSYFDNYNSDAPQRDYYGDPTQTSTNIDVKGQAELSQTELGQTARESYVNNPADKISYDSDMMKYSDEIRENANAIAALAAAGKDFAGMDPDSVTAFTGKAMACRKSAAGFSNCCKSGGWGQDAGLAQCNTEEKEIGTGKEKKLVVKVGSYCSKKALGICLQQKEGYCVFDSKLARIVQEQGRRDQLGISFGSGKDPDCRGIKVAELQGIKFDRIDFSDFYDDRYLRDRGRASKPGSPGHQAERRAGGENENRTLSGNLPGRAWHEEIPAAGLRLYHTGRSGSPHAQYRYRLSARGLIHDFKTFCRIADAYTAAGHSQHD